MSHHPTRRAALLALAGAALAAPSAHAQGDWPSGPVRVVVPFAPGGSTDAVARLVSPGLSRRLGQPVVVENRSGGAGAIGTDAVSYGSTGNGTIGHLTMVLLQSRAGVSMPHVAYRGGGLAVNDTIAGHVDAMIGSAALVAPHVAGGTLRALVQFGPGRLPALARVPTAEEAGFPGLVAEAWWAVFAPAGTPAPIVGRMNDALREALSEEQTRRQMEETQQARLVLSDPPALKAFLDRQVETWGRVVRENGIRAD